MVITMSIAMQGLALCMGILKPPFYFFMIAKRMDHDNYDDPLTFPQDQVQYLHQMVCPDDSLDHSTVSLPPQGGLHLLGDISGQTL